MTDLFSKLHGFSWKDVPFPATTFRVQLRQDLAQHKFAETDGAHIEPTGRSPLQFEATIPFFNGLTPGPTEKWGPKPLYPDRYREFLAVCGDRRVGILVHPELGPIRCAIESCDTQWAGTHRGGCEVKAMWIEANEFSTTTEIDLATTSPVAGAGRAAQNLDAAIKALRPKIVDPVFVPGFFDAVSQLQAIGDTVTLVTKRTIGKLDRIVYRANAIMASIDRAKTTTTEVPNQVVADFSVNRNELVATAFYRYGPAAMLWPVRDAASRMKSAALAMKNASLLTDRPVVLFVVPKDQTLGLIATTTGADIGDLMRLNPKIVQSLIVPQGTIIRYYEPSVRAA